MDPWGRAERAPAGVVRGVFTEDRMVKRGAARGIATGGAGGRRAAGRFGQATRRVYRSSQGGCDVTGRSCAFAGGG